MSIVIITISQIDAHGSVNDKINVESSTYSPKQVSLLLEKTKDQLDSIPEDAPNGSANGKLRGFLSKQTVVIEELLTFLEHSESLFAVSSKIARGLEEKKKELASLSNIHHSIQPEHPTKEELDSLTRKAKDLNKRILETKDEINRQDNFVKLAPETKYRAEERRQVALDLIHSLKNQISSTTNTDEKELLQTQLNTAEIEFQIGEKTLSSLKSNLDHIEEVHPLLAIDLQIKQKNLEALANKIKIYRKNYTKELETQHQKTEIILAQKVAQVVDAKDPKEKFKRSSTCWTF